VIYQANYRVGTLRIYLRIYELFMKFMVKSLFSSVIAGEPEGSRRDCNTMEKQHSRRVYSISVVEEGDRDILL
jgi:hypothetical protein